MALGHLQYRTAIASGYLLMGANIVVQLILIPIALKAVGEYQFGIFTVLLSLVNFAVIGIAWMSGGAARVLGEESARQSTAAFWSAFHAIKAIYVGYAILLAVIAVAVALGFNDRIFADAAPEDIAPATAALIVAATYLVFVFDAAVDRMALVAQGRQTSANLTQLCGTVLAGIIAVTALHQGAGLPAVFGAYAAGALLSTVLTRRLLKKEAGACWAWRIPSKSDFRNVQHLRGKTGVGLFLHGALVLAMQADIALVGLLGGARAAAEFFLVWKLAEVVVQLIWRLSDPLSPYIIRLDVRGDPQLQRLALAGYWGLATVSLFCALIYCFFGEMLVEAWVGREVAAGPLPFILAAGAIFWLGTARLPIVAASAQLRLRPLNIVNSVELIGKWTLAALLFPWLGYLSLLVAINAMHVSGIAFLYYRLLRLATDRAQGAATTDVPERSA